MGLFSSFLNMFTAPKPQPSRGPAPTPVPTPANTSILNGISTQRPPDLGASNMIKNTLIQSVPTIQNAVGGGSIAPQGGGQSYGSGGGGGTALIPPASSYTGPSADDVTNQLRAAYGQAQDQINQQSPLLDQSYQTAQSDINNSLTSAQNAANNQKQSLNQQFGDVLRNTLQTYKDLGKQRQGTFSALGTLDSSAYQEQQFKADEDLANQQSRTQSQQAIQNNQIDNQLLDYRNQANSQLAQLATQYQAGKNAIASALAQNNIQEAGAISQALDQVRQRAQDVQNSIIQFANQAAYMKSLGYGVNNSIGSISASPFASTMQSYLNQVQQNGNSQYSLPQNASIMQGQGFINKATGKPYTPQELMQLGLQ